MKKEIIISVVIILIVVVLDIITQRYTNISLGKISDELEFIREDLINQNGKEAMDKIVEVENKWDEMKENFMFYIEHTELEKVEQYILETKSNIEVKEYSIAVQTLDTCDFMINHIKEKYKFSPQTIF